MEKILATIPETAVAIGCGRSTTYRLIEEAKLETVKVGRRRLVVVDSIRRYVASLQLDSEVR